MTHPNIIKDQLADLKLHILFK